MGIAPKNFKTFAQKKNGNEQNINCGHHRFTGIHIKYHSDNRCVLEPFVSCGGHLSG